MNYNAGSCQLEIEREAIRREKDKDKETLLSKEIAELSEKRDSLRAKWENEKVGDHRHSPGKGEH